MREVFLRGYSKCKSATVFQWTGKNNLSNSRKMDPTGTQNGVQFQKFNNFKLIGCCHAVISK